MKKLIAALFIGVGSLAFAEIDEVPTWVRGCWNEENTRRAWFWHFHPENIVIELGESTLDVNRHMTESWDFISDDEIRYFFVMIHTDTDTEDPEEYAAVHMVEKIPWNRNILDLRKLEADDGSGRWGDSVRLVRDPGC